jgi:hypothetical protein
MECPDEQGEQDRAVDLELRSWAERGGAGGRWLVHSVDLLGYAATRSAAARYPDSSCPAWQKKLR